MKNEWRKFIMSLSNHPGVAVVFALNVLGFIAGFGRLRPPSGMAGGLLGATIMSIFWVPVLLTAWTGRNGYKDHE